MNNSSRVFTPAAQQAQAERSSAPAYARRMAEGFPDRVTPELAKFIAEQDTAFLATASRDGAPICSIAEGQGASLKSSTKKRSALPIIAAIANTSPSPIFRKNDRAYLF